MTDRFTRLAEACERAAREAPGHLAHHLDEHVDRDDCTCCQLERSARFLRSLSSSSAEDAATICACPHGCGGMVNSADASCASCRRGLNETRHEMPGICWAWFGPSDHRMKCRRAFGHDGEHETHHEDPTMDERVRAAERSAEDAAGVAGELARCRAYDAIDPENCIVAKKSTLRTAALLLRASASAVRDEREACARIAIAVSRDPRWRSHWVSAMEIAHQIAARGEAKAKCGVCGGSGKVSKGLGSRHDEEWDYPCPACAATAKEG